MRSKWTRVFHTTPGDILVGCGAMMATTMCRDDSVASSIDSNIEASPLEPNIFTGQFLSLFVDRLQTVHDILGNAWNDPENLFDGSDRLH